MDYVEYLIREKKWSEAEKRIERLDNGKRTIGRVLRYASGRSEIPLELIKLLLSKLKQNHRLDNHSHKTLENFLWYEFFGGSANDYCDSQKRSNMWTTFVSSPSQTTIKAILSDARRMGKMRPSVSTISNAVHFYWRDFFTGRLPPRLLDVSYQRYTSTKADAAKQEELLNVTNVQSLLDQSESLKTAWEKTKFMVTYTPVGTKGVTDSFLLHKIVKAKLPSIVVWLGIRCFREQLRIRDPSGHLPFHYSASCPRSDNSALQVWFTGELEEANASRFNLVISAFPEAASYLPPDGTLPLTDFIRSLYQHGGSAVDCRESIQNLIKAEPRALSTRDMNSHFYPFMTAASVDMRNSAQLDIIYMLLRADPTLVSAGIKQNRHEVYLNGKVAELSTSLENERTKNESLQKKNESLQKTNESLQSKNESLMEKNEQLKAELLQLKRNASGPQPDFLPRMAKKSRR